MGTVLVTGGTGLLGAVVARHLIGAGHDVRILSRSASPEVPPPVACIRGDLRTGVGLHRALAGTDAVVHCASDPRAFQDVDVAGTRRLVETAGRLGRPHLVYISIVGVDRIPWAYYRAKLAAEHLVEHAGSPWTILRTTQFHEFSRDLLERLTRLPLIPVVPGWRFQPIDVRIAAQHLIAAVTTGPAGRLPDLGGPEVLHMADLVGTYLRATGQHRRPVRLPVPGRFSAAFRAGANLAESNRSDGLTWQEFLAAHATRPGADLQSRPR
jgi:uncharacterized protein YbjT (DUF2867 family)